MPIIEIELMPSEELDIIERMFRKQIWDAVAKGKHKYISAFTSINYFHPIFNAILIKT